MSEAASSEAQLVAIVGAEAAGRLLAARGGTRITIPVEPRGSMLAEIVGEAAAETLSEALGPGRISLPTGGGRGTGRRRAAAMRMLREGGSLQAVALACDLHIRTVSKYREELTGGRDDGQAELPFDPGS